MKKYLLPKRFAVLLSFTITCLILSFLVRVTLYIYSFSYIDFSFTHLLQILGIGFSFDLGNLSYVLSLYALYLLTVPVRFIGSKFDRIITRISYSLVLFVMVFSYLAEITFWEEYQRRFNFIAIDYLLYTYEVIENINESFPIPWLIAILVSIVVIISILSKKAFKQSFESKDTIGNRLVPTIICFCILGLFHFNIKNSDAEVFSNINENELSKSGIYSFFAAYKKNELNYDDFYDTIPAAKLHSSIEKLLKTSVDSFIGNDHSIKRLVINNGVEQRPNVIFIGMESLSAKFLTRFGQAKNYTPAIDSIFKQSVGFTKMYATGTRTIRGLEAISLSIPPTPGRSIVKRSNNENLFTVGEIFRQKGYTRTFITGGDGLFDNMADYFSYNGFDIVDRPKDFRSQPELPTKRIQITEKQVTFANAWGACDEDIYNVVIDKADQDSKSGNPFFYLFMTNSNHPPYTYPDGVVSIPSGTNREGALRYADKAFERFFDKVKDKPWFENTVFVVMADHCAYSAGRTEINVENHHIPAFIYNLKNQPPVEINKLISQIDILPTLFGYLNWSYTSSLFGRDINKVAPEDERAFIGNYRKLGLLKNDRLMVLEAPRQHTVYDYDMENNKLSSSGDEDTLLLNEAVSYYQSAYELFKNGGIRTDSLRYAIPEE